MKNYEADLDAIRLESPFIDTEIQQRSGNPEILPEQSIESPFLQAELSSIVSTEKDERTVGFVDEEDEGDFNEDHAWEFEDEDGDEEDSGLFPEQSYEPELEELRGFDGDLFQGDQYSDNEDFDEEKTTDLAIADDRLLEGDEDWEDEAFEENETSAEPAEFEFATADDEIEVDTEDEILPEDVFAEEVSFDPQYPVSLVTEEEALSGSALQSAVSYNKQHAASVGWLPYFDQIVNKVLKLNYSPHEEAFAQAIADWQSKQPGAKAKDIDGKLGPGTWKKIQPHLGLELTSMKGPLKEVTTKLPKSNHYSIKRDYRGFGIKETIDTLVWIADEWHKMHPETKMGFGDISQKGGGWIGTWNKNGKKSGHSSHRIGLDVDIALIDRKTGRRIGNHKRQSNIPLVSDYEKYKHVAQDFVELVTSSHLSKVTKIWFFDHELHDIIKDSDTSKSHYRHFHLRFCAPQRININSLRNKVYEQSEKKAHYKKCAKTSNELFYNPYQNISYPRHDQEVIKNFELSGSDLQEAVAYNRKYMDSIGWRQYYDQIVATLFRLNYSPDEEAFAEELARWQDSKDLDPDGKLGPGTWKKMQSILGIGGSKSKTKTSSKSSYKAIDWSNSEQFSLINDFIARYATTQFRNSTEINAFFKRETGYEFCEWFRAKVGNRGFFGKIPKDPKYTGPRGRSSKNIQKGQESNFRKVYDKIPLLYSGDAASGKRINLLEFFALTTIIINEHSGNFTVGTEKGSLQYLFRYNPKDKSSPRSAYNLLHNKVFMASHSHRGQIPSKPFSQKWKLRGKDNYPSSSPTSVSKGGLISEMDFCKFRGRGLTQITFRGTYRRLISHIMSGSYRSSSTLVNNFKTKYAGKSSNSIAVRSSNKEWDDLFLKTDYEIACVAIYVFQKNRNDFLDIDLDKNQLIKESMKSSGAGSLFYVGYRQGGPRHHYGRVVKKRVMQMMDALMDG